MKDLLLLLLAQKHTKRCSLYVNVEKQVESIGTVHAIVVLVAVVIVIAVVVLLLVTKYEKVKQYVC